MSQLSVALEILKETHEPIIKQTELLSKVATKCGHSRESVRGSIIGFAPHKLMGQSYFRRYWVFCRKPARFVRKNHYIPGEEYEVSYDTAAKSHARNRILTCLWTVPTKKPRVLTLAGHQGLCVQAILKMRPKAEIYNAEYCKDILNEYQMLGLPTIDYLGKIGNVITEVPGPFDLINYDSVSYACGYIDADIQYINKVAKTEWLALTILGIQKFRNHGRFATWARQTFGEAKDPTKAWLHHRLTKYRLADHFYYNRDPTKSTRKMRVFIFKLKDTCDILAEKQE